MSRIKLVMAIGTSAALIAGCSSSGKGTSSDSTPPPAGTSTAPLTSSAPIASAGTTPASSAVSSPVSASDLSGTWNGRYSGAFSGTFVLKWTQSGSKLTGTITLSTAPGALPINGTVSGGHIQFGTVGSTAITYTGSASKSSMSGNYKVGGNAAATGSWTATKA
jgi:hypothetical protein